jgi:hypothetical protein
MLSPLVPMDHHPQYWIRVAVGRASKCRDQAADRRIDGDQLSLADARGFALFAAIRQTPRGWNFAA